TGLATSAKDHVGTLANGLSGRAGTPFGVSKGHIQTTGVESGDGGNIRIHVQSAIFVTDLEGDDRGNQVGAQNGRNRVGFGQHTSQRTSQEASFVFVEDEASDVGYRFTLELIYPDEVYVRVGSSR